MEAVRFSRLKKAFEACRGAFVSVGVFSFFTNLLMLTGPLFMLQVYDRVLTSGSIPTLVALVVLVVLLYVFMGILEYVRTRILVRIGVRLDEQLGGNAFDAVQHHAIKRTANVGSHPVRDLDQVRQFVSGPGPLAFFDTPWMPVYLGVIFLLHPWLGYYAVVGAIILFVYAVVNDAITRKPAAKANETTMISNALTEESRRNAEVIGAMGMSEAIRKRWQQLHAAALVDNTHVNDRAGSISALSKVTRMMLQSGMLGLGAYLAVKQEISPGTMIAGTIILSRALSPVEQAITHWRAFLGARKSYGRLKLVLDEAPERVQPMDLPSPEGKISVENLLVTVPGLEKPLLQGINFVLEPGEALGVLGPTGAGKSTLARTLVGVWPPTRGGVRLDGALLDQWNDAQLGKYIGYLPQNVELFSATIEENIARFQPDASPEKVVEAAKMADVHEMILRLPDGYGTQIGDGGSVLSAGQRQRIGLARALYGKPVFVVLDEPNSNLDAEGEAAVIHAIKALKEAGSSVVVIAHRPSAIGVVDKILFIKEATQLAFGPRQEVLDKILKSRSPDRQDIKK
ncbi:Type I secretion system ATPase [hydrothermal vent metagenome]|uniref:Type I secretion system ATPase n=1 Tax=hydrothermal vent metagenome TaxID=652676 RepID=A0A3B0S2J6_9ZZZZ